MRIELPGPSTAAQPLDAVECAKRELEAFSYAVSHDLRAPLRHIAGFAALLQERSAPDPASTRYVSEIRRAARHMGELIDGLLSMARVDGAPLRKTAVDMAALVAEARVLLEEDRRARWEVGSLPKASGDPVLLKLVWTNLLANALKYSSREAQPRIEIGASAEDARPTVFWVRDNGVGFDARYSARLFNPFQRLHQASEFEGIGIGLVTVRRIVERHGGRVGAESRIGAGATFYFTLGPDSPVRSEVSGGR